MYKPSDDTKRAYRACFSSEIGKLVLGDILNNAGYFDDDITSPEEMAVKNFAQRIIKKLGIGVEPSQTKEYVSKILEM